MGFIFGLCVGAITACALLAWKVPAVAVYLTSLLSRKRAP